jgi:hypothetical protein
MTDPYCYKNQGSLFEISFAEFTIKSKHLKLDAWRISTSVSLDFIITTTFSLNLNTNGCTNMRCLLYKHSHGLYLFFFFFFKKKEAIEGSTLNDTLIHVKNAIKTAMLASRLFEA